MFIGGGGQAQRNITYATYYIISHSSLYKLYMVHGPLALCIGKRMQHAPCNWTLHHVLGRWTMPLPMLHVAMTCSMGNGMVHLASAWCKVQLHDACFILLPMHNTNGPCNTYNVYVVVSIMIL